MEVSRILKTRRAQLDAAVALAKSRIEALRRIEKKVGPPKMGRPPKNKAA